MVSVFALSSFTSTPCSAQEQGGIVRTQRLSTQNRGKLRVQETKNQTYNIPKRRSSHTFAYLPVNSGKTDVPLPSNKNLSSKCSFHIAEHEGELVQESSISTWTKIIKQLYAFYKFSRPTAVYATIIGVTSMSLLPVQTLSELSPTFFIGYLKAVVPTVLAHLYLNGVNQLSDIGSDKINKPYLPLISGEISVPAATAIVAITAISSMTMAVMFKSPPLLYATFTTLFLGTVYSVDLPLLRWKNNAFLATICIVSKWSLVAPLCLFAHMQKYVLGKPLVFTKPAIFSAVFTSIMVAVGTAMKDIPDEEGDKAFGFCSLSVIYGREKVFWACVYILMAAYGGVVVIGATSTLIRNKIITVLGHCTYASIFWIRAKSLDISDPKATSALFMLLWKLLIAEYLLIPFVA